MRRILYTVFSLVLLAPFTVAQDVVPPAESFCAPIDDVSASAPIDAQKIERVRIELLERGFNPGFQPERNAAADAQLAAALARFQKEYRLPVTGQIDANTLAALSVPTGKSPADTTEQVQRSKPAQ